MLRAFSFALVVGIVVGTYSSFGIAAPSWWLGISIAAGARELAMQRRIRSRKARGGSRKEVVIMFDELVVSSANPKKTNKPWTVVLSSDRPGRDSGRLDFDSADLHGSAAQGNADHVSGRAAAASAPATPAAVVQGVVKPQCS